MIVAITQIISEKRLEIIKKTYPLKPITIKNIIFVKINPPIMGVTITTSSFISKNISVTCKSK